MMLFEPVLASRVMLSVCEDAEHDVVHISICASGFVLYSGRSDYTKYDEMPVYFCLCLQINMDERETSK